MAVTEFKYDVFISYSSTDEGWVVETLLPTLEKAGLKVCIHFRDFPAGKPAIINMQDAAEISRHTVLVMTPDWVTREWTLYEGLLTRTNDPAGLQRRTIPLLLKKCDVPKFISMLTWVDFTRNDRDSIAWNQLIDALNIPEAKTRDIFTRGLEAQAMQPASVEIPHNEAPKASYPYHWTQVSGSIIFHERLCEAFPGLRDTEIFRGEEAVDRLQILLRDPLVVKLPDNNGQKVPFWWFRGLSNMYIERLERLGSDRILLDIMEMRIDYIVAVRKFTEEERNFVYVQVFPENQTGLYEYPPNWLNDYLQERLENNDGYYVYEEYGIWRDKLIKRAEYDDGASLIEGKPTDTRDASLRVRYLTPYNFVICGNNHVLNSPGEVDFNLTKLLNEILLGTKTINDLVDFVASLTRFSRYAE